MIQKNQVMDLKKKRQDSLKKKTGYENGLKNVFLP